MFKCIKVVPKKWNAEFSEKNLEKTDFFCGILPIFQQFGGFILNFAELKTKFRKKFSAFHIFADRINSQKFRKKLRNAHSAF